MRYRIYFTKKSKKKSLELEDILRICDDHGRVVFGKPPKRRNYNIPHYTNEEKPYC